MLTETDREIAKEFKRRLSVIAPVLDICVFGSRARGEAAADSDMDVFIELETLDPELREQIFELAWEVGFETDRVITTIVTTHKQLQYGIMGANPLIRNIEREGIHI
ncbi:MAG: nucleotidyltransferase family protein [Desulfococcaceae bacterium]